MTVVGLLLTGRTRRRWSWISVLLCYLCLLASFHVDKAAAQNCYCNTDDAECVNNSCDVQGGHCIVELMPLSDGQYKLKYDCIRGLLGCITTNPYRCCNGNNCNMCQLPEFEEDNELLRQPEGLDVHALLPPECRGGGNTTSSSPPTPPSPDPNSTQSTPSSPDRNPFTAADTTVDGASMDTTTQPGDFNDSEVPVPELGLPTWIYIIIFLSILVVLVCIVFVVVIFFLCYRRRHRCEVDSIGSMSISEMESFPYEVTLSNDSEGLKHSRWLEPRTIGQQVVFKERLAKGGFGEVWRGDLNGEPVAVKVISSLLEECWKKEQEVYLTNMLHHESILRFIAVDSKLIDYSQKLIIIVEYHPHGSLFDYLFKYTITSGELLKLMTSVINGIAFLHMPVKTSFVEREKPAIAHRDLKTKNILVKQDGTCCIADFGLSVRSDDFSGKKQLPDAIKGTKRYMAPEILNKTINGNDFQSFIKVDIYSFGLVLWETARRCRDVGDVGEYQVPYQNCVPNDPSIEDMKKVVVTQEIRPDIDERWNSHEVLSTVSSIMQECWRANPHSRLTAFRIKKNLQALSNVMKEDIGSTKPDHF